MTRLHRFAWVVLLFNLAVILWGAFVRATGSGAGCGAHWPLCNGEVVPARARPRDDDRVHAPGDERGRAAARGAPRARGSSATVAKGHPARAAAGASVFFILTEAAVGAGLVLFRLVAENESVARALFMAGHLANTFLLLASLALTAHWCGTGAPVRRDALARDGWLFGLGALVLLAVGKSGAVAALGDTLYPAQSILGGLAQDLSPTAHFLVRLRIAHPVLALAGALVAAFVAGRVLQSAEDGPTRRAAWLVPALAVVQIARRHRQRGAPRTGLDAGRPPAAGRRAVDRVRAPGRARPRPAEPAATPPERSAPGDGLAP